MAKEADEVFKYELSYTAVVVYYKFLFSNSVSRKGEIVQTDAP